MPCRPDGTICDAHDPANHITRAQAEASGLGVAFALRADDPWFFLDLDKCRDDSGNWSSEAVAIWNSFAGAWGEMSQSGRGLHIMGYCDASRLADRRNKWAGWLEFYTKERFIAFGGHGWAPIGGTATNKDWTDQLLHLVPQREYLGELPDGRDPSWTGPEDDAELLALAMRSSNAAGAFGAGITFADLWEARTAPLAAKFPSYDGKCDFDHSSADAALMSHLAFWTGKDMPRMDRLFRTSDLMRDKYDKRADYRRDTVQNAARLCKRVYDVPRKAVASSGSPSEVFLTIPEMIDYFKGCVYVRDSHRVLVPDGAMLRPEQFNASYGGHMFQMMPDGTKPTRKAFEALTECIAHRFPQATRPVFRPLEPSGAILSDGAVNIYVKPNIPVVAGDVSPFVSFMQRLLPDANDRAILMAYMASVVQNPGKKFQWAPVLQGTEGNGKTLVASCVAYAVGDQYVHQPRASQLAEKYNDYIIGSLFIIVEEIHMGGRREMLDELKPTITNLRVEIRSMNRDKYMADNFTNWFFCTNHKDAVIKSKNDRRYAIFFTAQQSAEDIVRDGMGGDYFPKLYAWLRNGGYAHVAHMLHNYNIPDELNPATSCHRAPITSSTAAAITASIGGIESEVMECVESQTVGFRGGWISSFALDRMLRDRGLRLSRARIGEVMATIGYRQWGRAPRAIMREEGKRPVIWTNETAGTFEQYLAAQGPGYD